MKMTVVLAAAVMMVSSGALVMAQNNPGGDRPARPQGQGQDGQGQGQGRGQGRGQGDGQGNRGNRGGWGQMRSPYANQYDVMIRELSLTDEQKPKVKAKVDEMNKELDEFREDAGTRMRGMFQPGGDGNREEAMKKMQETMLKIGEDQQKLVAEHQSRINAELTAEQREKWEVYKLTRTVNDRLRMMNPTAEQNEKIKPLILASAKEIVALKDEKDTKAVATIHGNLVKKILNDVLTPEQVGMLIGSGNQMQPLMNMFGGMGGGGGPGGPRRGGDGLP